MASRTTARSPRGRAARGAQAPGRASVARSDAVRVARARRASSPAASSTSIIGVLALKLALGDGGKTTNQQGALKTIAQQPFGKVAAHPHRDRPGRLRALAPPARGARPRARRQRDDTKDRIAGLVSGIAYAALCVTAVKILLGSGTSSGSGNPEKATGGVLGLARRHAARRSSPASSSSASGSTRRYKGVKKKFLEKSKTEQMSADGRAGVHRARRLRPRRPRRSSSR